MAIPALLDELLRAHGAPGGEGDVQAIVRREAGVLGLDVTPDVLGATVARVDGSAARTVALVAHTDQIALGITRIDDDGLLRVGPLGVWQPTAAVGQRFAIKARAGRVPAVGVRRGTGDITWDDVRLDVGVSSAAEARGLVSPGDAAVFDSAPFALEGTRFTSPAIDDRVAVYAGIELLRRFAALPGAWGVALVASVQEEGGKRTAAEASLASLDAEIALILETSYASDAPTGYDAWGECPLGGGATVFRGPVVHPAVADGLLAAAESLGLPMPIETGTTTMTDGDDLFVMNNGLAVGLVAVPARYVHTAHELADLRDVEAMIEITERYIRSVPIDASFLR